MTPRFRLVLCAAFGVLAVVCALAYGEAAKGAVEAQQLEALERYGGELVTIVVAAEPLEAGDEISPVTCEEREWVSSLVPEGALVSLADVVGTCVTSPISAGTPLTQAAVRQASGRLDIPSGQVAVTVPVTDRLGVASEVEPGSSLAVYRVIDGQTRLISAQAFVVASAVSPDLSSTRAITVAVPEAEIAALLAALGDGTLRLAMPASDVLLANESSAAEAAEVAPVAPGSVQDASESSQVEPITDALA